MSFDFEYENYLEEDEIDGRHTENQNTNSQQQSSNQKSGGNAPNCKKELIKGVECSARSTERFTVRFVNTTDKCVDVIWLDFEGQPVTYETLQPQTAWSVYTYKTHPWIFRDSNCPNERLVVKKNKVKRGYFECGDFLNELKYNREYNNIINGEVPICVLIQLPVVEDLRQLALKTVKGHINRKEDCFCLNILPQQIQFEIAEMFV